MASELKEGGRVAVVDREATPADEKSGTFYNHFRNLTGVLEKVYDDGNASVVVEVDSLPVEIQQRHKDLTEKAKQKWLDGLSSEARNKLTPDEQEFQMRYTILVSLDDLAKATGKTAAEEKAVSAQDLDQAEEQFLKSRQAAKQD